ncbi:alpha-ketoacid dehydrogenase subunit alpha/beta [Flavilitoribacter nigricans]|uniref:3-methyl-2-oxobutanoate dehydrogenase (2-methylpropanoyl-transferring) n=1 Tax=Flavilitoribacter nigricans (strain ATCC 23147 / DSM 23189 / NBRC 102662 / NCIMB 1420 / SS-2) TaxID=1122177 RepID=A0A2D0MY96_FLAN2|nr:thiamine pyrophosphate-dependent enzyme [Flavilitoribacter nigricans]PHN01187.1 transketolase [Flavilitoribacter nigricans DSM 23189 = NBRC 102662]
MSEEKSTSAKTSSRPSTKGGPDKSTILRDFRICCISREVSILARREVLTGKAKFGITGDGKEVPQVVMAHFFQKGDFRSGYYRDQTLMLALELCTIEDLFAQLYADPLHDPFSGGRQMNSHFATPLLNEHGEWLTHTDRRNVSSDISSTAGQMARALGLAHASKKYRELPDVDPEEQFSKQGQEVVFCTIGDASTSEGVFWETINAAGVTQVPLAVSVWDDGYGISVPKRYQTTKESISTILEGFRAGEDSNGWDIYTARGWDYAALWEMYAKGIEKTRRTHRPALFHVDEITQPQGHSTSGSHERYKSKERLQWEKEKDGIRQLEHWIIASEWATQEELEQIRREARKEVRAARDRAWSTYNQPSKQAVTELKALYEKIPDLHPEVEQLRKQLQRLAHPFISEVVKNARQLSFQLAGQDLPVGEELKAWIESQQQKNHRFYSDHLYDQTETSALRVPVVPAVYSDQPELKNGYEILNQFFKEIFARDTRLLAFGEDVGQIGDVNQGFAGLQKRFGKERVFDTGIREWTIVGQAIGLAMRGFRPIAEIQYLDYLVYGLQPLMDDLATLRWRSNGRQMAPAIIRTRGHRLEGVWHTGSPLGMILNALRGMYVLVPRDMTRAAGMYNTLLQSNDPALLIECLNGYRLKEEVPENLSEFTVPLGVPEVLEDGTDLTLVTYGSSVRVAREGIRLLENKGISVELIDVQTLLPFDLEHRILSSLQKTNRILFLDEDVPGGATAYMLQQVLEVQGGYRYLDSPAKTLTARAHRSPYGSDGDYYSKPNAEDVFETVYNMIREADPRRLPAL